MAILLEKELKKLVSREIQAVLEKVSVLAQNFNVDAFLIGGIVRDILLENKISDIDIAVQGNATEFAKYIEERTEAKVIAIQENLKTAKVEFENNIVIDFASTREEKYSKSGVLPVAYNFGCRLEEDVKRRDFTINTLAIQLTGEKKHSLVDYYNGYQDLKEKKIRILHNRSFIDDPSRIIRALKFQKRLDFEIEEITYNLMQNYLFDVDKEMPLERVKNELKQYFSIKTDNLYSTIIETKAYKLISDNPILDINVNNFERAKDFQLEIHEDIWFIYFILLILNSDFATSRLNLTGYELRVIQEIKSLMNSAVSDTSTNKEIYSIFNNMLEPSIFIYYFITGNKAVEKFFVALKEIKVLLTGKDLIDLGFIPSAYFNKLFDKILTEKLNGKLKTKEEEIEFVKQFGIIQ